MSICAGDSVTLNLDTLSGNFIWSTGETSSSITVDPVTNTNYSVTVTSGSCVAQDDININIGAVGCDLDLYVLKSVNDAAPEVGDTITFTIELGNNSGLIASGVQVFEEILSGFGYISSITSQGNYNLARSIWDVGTINPLQSAYLYIDVEVLGSGNYNNIASLLNVDQDDTNPSNDSETVTITPTQSGGIGNLIWHDSNGDGIQDLTEAGMQNIGVELYQIPNNGIPIATLFTDILGEFCFTGLSDGDYYVKIIVPTDMMVTIPMVSDSSTSVSPEEDSDITGAYGFGTTDMITILNGAKIKSCDGGLHFYGSIGDIVWLDDIDGIPSVFETGIDTMVQGALIKLYRAHADTLIETTFTDINGYYLFDRIEPGDYYMEISNLPNGTILVQPDVASDDIDNDFYAESQVIQNEGHTQIFSIGIEMDNMDFDGGIEYAEGVILLIELFDIWVERMYEEQLNRLFWITDTEINTDYFLVERAINQIHTFEEVGIVDAAGNSTARQYYTFDDLDSRFAGIYYYRIWTVDKDGRKEKSRIVSVEVLEEDLDAEILYKVYPIPTTDYIKIELNSPTEKLFQGFLINNLGQNVRKLEKQTLPSGISVITIELRDLAQGQYYLNFYLGEEQHITKILVMD